MTALSALLLADGIWNGLFARNGGCRMQLAYCKRIWNTDAERLQAGLMRPAGGTAGREPISCLLNLHKAFRFDMHRCAPERNARIWRVFRSPRLLIQAWPGQFAAFEAFGGGRRDARQFDALRFRRGHGERHAVIVVPSVSPSIICPQDWLACRTKSVGCAGDAKTILKNWKRHWFAGCVRGTRGKIVPPVSPIIPSAARGERDLLESVARSMWFHRLRTGDERVAFRPLIRPPTACGEIFRREVSAQKPYSGQEYPALRIAPAPQRLFKRQTEQDSGARNGNATGIASAATPPVTRIRYGARQL